MCVSVHEVSRQVFKKIRGDPLIKVVAVKCLLVREMYICWVVGGILHYSTHPLTHSLHSFTAHFAASSPHQSDHH